MKPLLLLIASVLLCAVASAQTFNLSVQSGPITGVPMQVSPADINNNGNGNTNFTRTYNTGTSVNLVAPFAVGSYRFTSWTFDGVQQTAGQTALSVSMTADHTAFANYQLEYQLVVQSQYPNSGVAVTVAPNDVDGNGNGTTTFTRYFAPAVAVTLTAPSSASGNAFLYWTVDGTQQTAGQTTLNLTMGANHTVVAVYQTYTLTVQSQNPNSGVAISDAPPDANGNGNGTTTYTRTYNTGTSVTLTAPATASGNSFLYWTLDGTQQTAGQTTLTLTMSADHTVVAVYQTFTLTVQSQNPNSGVAITDTPNDINGNGNGTTAYTRTYNTGTSVTLTAPGTASGNVFAYWTLDGAQQTAGQAALTLTMGANHTAVAVYVTQYTLTVQSQNPSSGVAITDTPNDVNGNGNGTTAYTRTYNSGTSVTLTAPGTASGNVFAYWTLDGAQQTAGQTGLTISMGANHTAVAVYLTQFTLTVQSQNPSSSVAITDSPNDVNGNGNGTTTFTRTYDSGASVTLTAPATASGNVFGYWTLDGTQQTAGQTALSVAMGANHTAVAVYLSQFSLAVQSQNPNSGVAITDAPNDVNGNGNGTTSFTRTYNSGTSVTLTAPASASGNVFAYWTLDGVQQTAGQTGLTVSMGAHHTAVAVYQTQFTLTVQSQNPNSGVAITDTPNDVNGSGNGTTAFTRTYNTGASVTLTAPATASGNTFAYWTLDGTQQTAGQTALTLTMSANHTAVAVYLTQFTLTVQSQNPNSGVAITAAPSDINGGGNGSTAFTRTYNAGTSVTLTAPATASGNAFAYWTLDGAQQTAGQVALTLTVGANHTAVAVYLTQFNLIVQSLNPNSGVAITGAPNDVNGNGNGTTSFTRVYNSGASVTLTAPATASGNKLAFWTLDGTAQTAGQVALTVTMGASHTAVAVYSLIHPADKDGSFSIGIQELTAYGSAWKHGATWPTGPNPIPQGYVTNAAGLWRAGEGYVYDPTHQPPDCWKPSGRGIGRQASKPGTGRAVSSIEQAPGAIGAWVVTIVVTPTAGTGSYSLQDLVPSGARVSAVSGQGFFDAATGAIRWGPFLDAQPRTFTYQISGVLGGRLSGKVSFDGSIAEVRGARQVGASSNGNARKRGNR